MVMVVAVAVEGEVNTIRINTGGEEEAVGIDLMVVVKDTLETQAKVAVDLSKI